MPPPAACRRIDAAERRARLAVRHHLAAPASDVATAAADLVGLHSSDPVTVYLSAWSRVRGFQVAHLEEALYESAARSCGCWGCAAPCSWCRATWQP